MEIISTILAMWLAWELYVWNAVRQERIAERKYQQYKRLKEEKENPTLWQARYIVQNGENPIFWKVEVVETTTEPEDQLEGKILWHKIKLPPPQ